MHFMGDAKMANELLYPQIYYPLLTYALATYYPKLRSYV